MISAVEYRKKNQKLMVDYEQKVRAWLWENGKKEIAEKIPFFRDGVVCPEVWFKAENEFRPLFILKEVSLGIEAKESKKKSIEEELSEYLKEWGNPKYFEFAENPFDDVQVGKFNTWRRIARLAKALEDVYNRNELFNYESYDLTFHEGGEVYTGDIIGYKKYGSRTANALYQDIISKIAFLEIKKIGSGKFVNSELSIETKHFTEHIEPFKDFICKQIDLINPTVVICCGKDSGRWTSEFLSEIREKTGDRCWIDCYHPAAYGKYAKKYFFEEPIRTYKEYRDR